MSRRLCQIPDFGKHRFRIIVLMGMEEKDMNKTGFGFLRLPLINPEDETSVDYALTNQLVDRFIAEGGTYFDTAYTYLGGASEKAVKKALTERYPRESFRLADKLPSWKVNSHEDCYKYFEEQLLRCKVTYFDTYLLHWLNQEHYEIAVKYGEFEFLRQLKETKKAAAIGFSYHDGAELLDKILTEYPYIDYVQLQINYLDWESPSVESRKCYETAVKHGKKVLVMEPVKGGKLASLPETAENVFRAIHPKESMASWALRFVQSLKEVEIVLSGMNSMEQIIDNMKEVNPIDDREKRAIEQVCEIINRETAIPCTGCAYCTSHCPKKIAIPVYFNIYNEYCRNQDEQWKMQTVYNQITQKRGKASACIHCKLCEKNCPQKILITKWLEKVSEVFG